MEWEGMTGKLKQHIRDWLEKGSSLDCPFYFRGVTKNGVPTKIGLGFDGNQEKIPDCKVLCWRWFKEEYKKVEGEHKYYTGCPCKQLDCEYVAEKVRELLHN